MAHLGKNQPMERECRKELFTRFELFQGFTEGESRMVDQRVEEKRFLRGDAIFRRADPGDSLYLLMEGLVKIVAYSGRGPGTVIYILRPPDIFGELLLSEEKRPFHALAATDVRAGVLSREHVVELLSRIPRFRLNFIRNLSHRLVRVAKGVTEFRHAPSSRRLARVLLRMSGEDGEETPGGFPLQLSLTHADLAEMIGTTRETVTNQLNRFRRLGLVETRNRRLVVDRRRLADYLRAGATRRAARWRAARRTRSACRRSDAGSAQYTARKLRKGS